MQLRRAHPTTHSSSRDRWARLRGVSNGSRSKLLSDCARTFLAIIQRPTPAVTIRTEAREQALGVQVPGFELECKFS